MNPVKPKKQCCKKPDIKNEGFVIIKNKKVWAYYCFNCHKSWEEKGEK